MVWVNVTTSTFTLQPSGFSIIIILGPFFLPHTSATGLSLPCCHKMALPQTGQAKASGQRGFGWGPHALRLAELGPLRTLGGLDPPTLAWRTETWKTLWVWLKNRNSKMACPGKRKHGPKPSLILSHCHLPVKETLWLAWHRGSVASFQQTSEKARTQTIELMMFMYSTHIFSAFRMCCDHRTIAPILPQEITWTLGKSDGSKERSTALPSSGNRFCPCFSSESASNSDFLQKNQNEL